MTPKTIARIAAVAVPSFAASTAFGFAVASLDDGGLDRDRDGLVQTMIIGDSLAASFFATTEQDGFAYLVQDEIGPVEVSTTTRAHQTLSTVAGVTEVPAEVEVAIIELGTNDVGIETPIHSFDAQYAALTRDIRAKSPDARIVCIGTWTGWGDPYDQAIEDECLAVGGDYVDMAPLFVDPANRGPVGRPTFVGAGDDFHPNDTGHRAVADAVLAVLLSRDGD
jgi:lysophospholipase L1-like esterase